MGSNRTAPQAAKHQRPAKNSSTLNAHKSRRTRLAVITGIEVNIEGYNISLTDTHGASTDALSLNSTSGTGNETALLSCQENTSATERSCVITFTCGAASAEYTFWQEAYVCSGAYINPETCTGCGLCAPECPIEGCITRIDDSYYRIDSNVCISCGTCLEAGCPVDAIEIL